MERYHFFAFLLCGVFMSRVLSVPLTSFSLDCESMRPDLPIKPQESESPYHVSVPAEEYDPGSEVKVNVEGTGDAGFKWFMLQAQDIEGNIPVGSFQITDPNTQGLDCYNMTNSALIHMGPDEKRNVSALWVSPEAKAVQFLATIFQDPETYWVTVPSIVVFPRDSNATADESESGDESKPADGSSRSRKKSSSIIVRVHCGPGGTGSSSECAKSSSQGGSSRPQGGIVYQGGVKKGCIGLQNEGQNIYGQISRAKYQGGTAGVYNKYGCTDPGIGSGSSSYGQSVSVTSDSKGKTIQYAPSNPYPPDRTSYTSQLANSKYKHVQSTQYANKVQTQGSNSQGGIRITIQNGQPGQVCDKTSSSYNTQACKTSIQSSTSQSGGSYGSQGGSTTKFGGSGTSTTYGSSGTSISVSGSGASTSVSVGGSGSSTSRGGSCGQGYTFDGNSCKQSGSSQQTYGTTQGGSPQKMYGSKQAKGGSSQQNYGSSQGGSSQQNYGSSQGGSSQQNYGSSQGGSSQQNYGSSQGGSSQQTYGTSQGGSSQQTYGANQGGSYTQGSRNPCDGSYSGKILSSSNCPQRGPSQFGAGNRPGFQGGQIYGQGSGSQNYGGYSSNNCDRGGVSGGKALSSANCRGKRDVAAVQDAFNAFIRKIQEKKATSHPRMRKIRSEKNETSNSRSFTPNAQDESISSSENNYDHDGSFMYINEVADCFCPGAQGGRGGVPVGGSSNQYGQAGRGGSYSGSRPYGQAGPYGGGGSQYGQSGSYGGSSQYGQGGQSGTYGGGSQYGQGGSYGGGSQYGQGGQSGSYGGGNQYGQGGQSGSYGGGNQYGQGGSYGGGSYGGGSSQYGQGGQSGSYGSSQYGQGGQSGSYGSSQYGQGGQSGSYGSSQYGQGGQSGSYGGGNQYGQGESYGGSSSGTSGTSSSQYGQNSSSSGGSRPGGKNSTSSGGSPTSGQGSPYSGGGRPSSGQGSPYSGGGRPSSGQGGCFCPGGIPGTTYAGSSQYGQGPSGGQYGGSSQYGGGQGSQYGSSSQYGGGQGSQYGGGRGSQYGSSSQYGGGQGSQYGSGSQYGGGRGSQYGSGSQYGGGRGSQYGGQGYSQYGGSQGSQYGSGQGYYPYGSSQYGSGRGGQHGPSSAGKQSTSSLMLITVLSAFAVCSSVVSKWLI